MTTSEPGETRSASHNPKNKQQLILGQDRLLGREDAKGKPYGARSSIKKRSVVIEGRKTSVSLENEFWDEAKTIARTRGQTMHAFVADVIATYEGHNFSSALRLAVLEHFIQRSSGSLHQSSTD